MRFILSVLSVLYVSGIFLLADSPAISKMSAFNPYSLLHIPLYGMLTIFLVFSFRPVRTVQNAPNVYVYTFRRLVIAGLIAFGVAIADELHQLYIPGREASILDVFLDLIGITFVLVLIHRLFKGEKARLSIQAEVLNCTARNRWSRPHRPDDQEDQIDQTDQIDQMNQVSEKCRHNT